MPTRDNTGKLSHPHATGLSRVRALAANQAPVSQPVKADLGSLRHFWMGCYRVRWR